MDVNEIARGLVVEHMAALTGLSVRQIRGVDLPKGSSGFKSEISEAMAGWLTELIPQAEFEIRSAGPVFLSVKRIR